MIGKEFLAQALLVTDVVTGHQTASRSAAR